MKFLRSLLPSALLLGANVVSAASSWSFDDAVVSVTSKKAGSTASKDKLSDNVPLSKDVKVGVDDSLKILLTAKEDNTPKRPHQAFLLLQDPDTGLETTFAFSMKESGKGKVDFTQKDIPIQLLSSKSPLRATLLLGSFGASKPFGSHVFNLDVSVDANTPLPSYEKPLRYGKLPEINHIFKADPKSGPLIISLFFTGAVLVTVPVLLGIWSYLGANLSHLGAATSSAPISHTLFFGSIVSMEGIFFLYYYKWSLFTMLPVAGVVGLVAFLSGSKALGEVQGRRLAGQR